VTTLSGSEPGFLDGERASALFNVPSGLAFHSDGTLYVADTGNHRIRALQADGGVVTISGTLRGFKDDTLEAARFLYPLSVSFFSSHALVVADSGNHRIRKVDLQASVVSTLSGSTQGFADGAGATARFFSPASTAVDSDGGVVVADSYNHAIRRVGANGETRTATGKAGGGFADGDTSSAQFNMPASVAVDAAGNIYVADSENHVIRRISSAGVVTTLAGNGEPGSCDGTGAAARFRLPSAVILHPDGALYVADTLNHLVRRVTLSGEVTTIAGAAATPGSEDGRGTSARFAGPTGLAADAAGALYVADTGNHRIRRVVP
jgi:sugar lactone lactonase YvrE